MSIPTLDVALFFAVTGMLLYFPMNRIQVKRRFFHNTALDDQIPLVPIFVIPYLALFPYTLFAAYALWSAPQLRTYFFVSLAIAAWTAALTWYLVPAGIPRQLRFTPDFFSKMIAWIYSQDTHDNNSLPSAHVFYALICSYFLALAYPAYGIIFWVIGVIISVSTTLVKQHHVADILGGVVWMMASILIAHFLVG